MSNFKPSPQKQKAIDDKVREKVRETFGHVVAVEGNLDFRYTEGKNWKPFQRFLLENGHTVFVSNWQDEINVTVSEKPAPKNSPSVRRFHQKQQRALDRQQREADREQEKAERAAKPKSEPKAKAPRKRKADAKSAYTPAREARIKAIIEETGGTRKEAIRQLWKEEEAAAPKAESKKVHDPLAQATVVKA